MPIDFFKDVLVPVVGGLGIFMLGLEFMSDGIQHLAVNKMRAFLARIAGTPIKGLLAGTFITGVIQSSTAMTVMVVGLVDSGVLGLRQAIAVIMGANIGTTIGNGLIALPLGPLGLLLGGVFALIYVFAKNEKVRYIAVACMGFALIFYGLNLMVGGLRPLRGVPEVTSAIAHLHADNLLAVIYCILIAALITAMIHSSSATIGIVMGLGASGVLSWPTAVAFSLGADLGTTITAWMASLNLSKNAKRAAYAHIAFNLIGVTLMLPLFFPALKLLTWAMGWFGGDPAAPVMRDGQQTFPLVPVVVGLYSTTFNIFNAALLLPFVGVFERTLSRIGHSEAENVEDFSAPRFLDAGKQRDLTAAVPLVQQELARYVRATGLFLAIARKEQAAPASASAHRAAIDILDRDIHRYTAALFTDDIPDAQGYLLASLIAEADFTASLGETLFQVAHRVEGHDFSVFGRALADATFDQLAHAMQRIAPVTSGPAPTTVVAEDRGEFLLAVRESCLKSGHNLPWDERGVILELLGVTERAFFLIDRIDTERQSPPRMS